MTRRSLLETAGLAVAGTGFAGLFGSPAEAQALDLPPGLPTGTRAQAGLDALPGKKMINVFGAPIDAADARIIADYLKKNYGS
jgi:hypothetical protein